MYYTYSICIAYVHHMYRVCMTYVQCVTVYVQCMYRICTVCVLHMYNICMAPICTYSVVTVKVCIYVYYTYVGDHIPLMGFDGYLGGLDNGSNLTGESSIYTEFANHEIMYHVSTLLPYTPKDPQQVTVT